MKVFIQIVDSRTGIYQCGMIDEPIKKGLEITNALGHFGININEVEWDQEQINSITTKIGKVRDTTKIISIIAI